MAEKIYRSSAYCGALLQRLKQLYDKGQLCDFSLVVDDVEVRVHSVVLFSASTYFKTLMNQGTLQDYRYCLQTCNVEGLRVLIHFIYTGVLTLSENNIWITLALASQLDIPEAVDLCQQFLQDMTRNNHSEEPLDNQISSQGAALECGQGTAVESIAARLKSGVNRAKPDAEIRTPIQDNFTSVRVKTEVEDFNTCDTEEDEYSYPEIPNDDYGDNFEDEEEDSEYKPPSKKRRGRKRKSSDIDMEETHEKSPPKRRGRPKGSKNKPKTLIDQLHDEVEKMKNRGSKKKVVPVLPAPLPPREKIHECSLCSKSFAWLSLLSAHQKNHICIKYSSIKAKHLVECAIRTQFEMNSRLMCRTCDMAFELSSRCGAHALKKHFQSTYHHHCQHCSSKPFMYVKNLKLHTFRQHKRKRLSKVRLLDCSFCDRQFLHETTLLLHKFSTHPSNVKVKKRSKPSIRKNVATFKRHPKPPPGSVMGKKRGRPAGKPNKSKSDHGPRWKCQERDCSHAFVAKNELLRHMVMKHPSVSYSCPEEKCKFSTNVKSMLEKHCKKFHDPSCTNVCEVCGKMFQRAFRLKMHMYSRHRIRDPNLTIYTCDVEGCKYSSVLKNGVDKHMRKHQPDKPFVCSICGKHFKTEKSVEKHTGKVHLGIRNYICDICGMAYGDESELKIHIIRHSDTKTFPCEHCDYATFDKGNYKTHLYCKHGIKLEEHMTIFECSVCDFTTSIKYQHTDHMRVHNKVRDIPCPQCDKKFITRKSMRSHVMKCHNPKDYHCTVCQYSSADKSKVREHIRIMHTHRHYKPYKCPYCNFQCATGGNCRKHVKHKHKGREVTYIKLDIPEPPMAGTSADVEMAHRVGMAQQPLLERGQDFIEIKPAIQEYKAQQQHTEEFDMNDSNLLQVEPIVTRDVQHAEVHRQEVHHQDVLRQDVHRQDIHQVAALDLQQQGNLDALNQTNMGSTQQTHQQAHNMVQALNMSMTGPYDASTVSWHTLNAMMQHHHMNMQ